MTLLWAPHEQQMPRPRKKLLLPDNALVTRFAARRLRSFSSLAIQASQCAPPTSRSQRLVRCVVVTAIRRGCTNVSARPFFWKRCYGIRRVLARRWARGNSQPMTLSYGSRRLCTNEGLFCCAALLANAETSLMELRFSIGSFAHCRMIFRRASRCLFMGCGITWTP